MQDKQKDIVEMFGKETLFDLNDKVNAYMSYSSFDMFGLGDSIGEKLGGDDILNPTRIIKNADEILALDLTERERTYVNAILDLNGLSNELAVQQEEKAESTL